MVKILICICSNNINKLKITLESLFKLRLLDNAQVSILIIDNSNNIKIKDFIKVVSKKKIHKIYYFYDKKKGIPKVRNRCLKEIRKIESNYICFFDDDIIIHRKWLIENFKIFKKFENCSIISGPQNSSEKNIYYDILKPNFKHLEKISWCPTNNVIFKKQIINNKKIRFDERLSNIGGSDQLFFKELSLKGYEIRWNNNFPVIEKFQKKRNTFSWFLKRNYRYASSSVLIDRYSFGVFRGLILSLFKMGFYFIFFLLNLFVLIFNPKKNFLKSIKNLVRAFSIFLSLLGLFPKSYV